MATLEEKRAALKAMAKAISHMAKAIADVHSDLVALVELSDDAMADFRGPLFHHRMEALGDILNGMDAVDEDEDAWVNPIFATARDLFPIKHEHETP